jgi:myo-inositol-1(or 4)-monophosphatase
VTEADTEAERAIRALIEAEHPDHGIVGEEFGTKAGSGRWSWCLDPVDGTRAFVCGLPSWTTLIALRDAGVPVLGVIDVPRVDELYLGEPGRNAADRCGRRAQFAGERVRTAGAGAFLDDRPVSLRRAEREAFERLRGTARLTRYGYDAYAYARLAAGSLDLVVESGLKDWDWQALVPVVRGAGGVVGNWQGGEDLSEGRLVAAATRPCSMKRWRSRGAHRPFPQEADGMCRFCSSAVTSSQPKPWDCINTVRW